MKRRILVGLALGVCVLAAAGAVGDSAMETYALVITLPNMAEASNGDRVAVTGMGTFTINPKGVMDMGGEFVHRDSAGTEVGRGTWRATELLSFQPYGCGIVTFPDPDVMLPENFCGGAVKMRILLAPQDTDVELAGNLTTFCIVGPNPPDSHDDPSEEGVTLNLFDAINFNQVAPGGTNIYIRMTP